MKDGIYTYEEQAAPQPDTLCPECENDEVQEIDEDDARRCHNCMTEWRAYASGDWTFYRVINRGE